MFRSTKRFGPDGKRFEHLSFLNLAQNVVCLIWSYISEYFGAVQIHLVCYEFGRLRLKVLLCISSNSVKALVKK